MGQEGEECHICRSPNSEQQALSLSRLGAGKRLWQGKQKRPRTGRGWKMRQRAPHHWFANRQTRQETYPGLDTNRLQRKGEGEKDMNVFVAIRTTQKTPNQPAICTHRIEGVSTPTSDRISQLYQEKILDLKTANATAHLSSWLSYTAMVS